MFRYLLKRLQVAIPTLFIVVTVAFFLIRLAPGGPFDSEKEIPAEIATNIERVYHLNEPLLVQYGYYIWNLLRGDFGPSFKYQDYTVTELIMQGFPVSLSLGLLAMLLALLIGVSLGLLAAVRQHSFMDHFIMSFAMMGIAIPNFVVAPLLALMFGVLLGWLPTGGWGTWQQMVLPVISLSLPQVAVIARMTRASLLETLHSPYIDTAKAKGMPSHIILLRHAIKPTLLPIISWLGPATAALITGSVVIEQIFGLPGIGRYFVNGALNRDYTLVMGVVVFYAFLIILMNLFVDLLYAVVDPRIQRGD